jgi:hypothetical protein
VGPYKALQLRVRRSSLDRAARPGAWADVFFAVQTHSVSPPSIRRSAALTFFNNVKSRSRLRMAFAARLCEYVPYGLGNVRPQQQHRATIRSFMRQWMNRHTRKKAERNGGEPYSHTRATIQARPASGAINCSSLAHALPDCSDITHIPGFHVPTGGRFASGGSRKCHSGEWLATRRSSDCEIARVSRRETAGLFPASSTKMLRHYPLYPLIAVVVVLFVFPWAAYLLRAALRTRNLPACWYCGAGKVRRSTPQHFLDTINTVLLLRPYRCSSCRIRFYAFPADTGEPRAL